MDYFDTGYHPSGFIGGFLSGENADIAQQRQQQDLERFGLENIVKQQQARQALQEMGSPEYNQARLAGLIGQSNSLSAKGQFDTQTLDPRIHASIAENYTKATESEIARKKANLDSFIASYEANNGNPVYTFEGISDPEAKKRLLDQARIHGLPALYQQAKAMRESYIKLDQDNAKFRNQKQLADEAHKATADVHAADKKAMLELERERRASMEKIAAERAAAQQTAKKAVVKKMSREPSNNDLTHEMQILGQSSELFDSLDDGDKIGAAKDVYLRAKQIFETSDVTEEEAYNQARQSIISELSPGEHFWNDATRQKTVPQQQIAPVEAINYLKSHPELKEAFKSKYGYLPE